MTTTYRAITTDSNLEPLAVEIRRDGGLMPLTAASGQITIRDQSTGDYICKARPVTIQDPGFARYTFQGSEVARILKDSTWLVEWRIETPEGLVFRSPQLTLPVKAKL